MKLRIVGVLSCVATLNVLQNVSMKDLSGDSAESKRNITSRKVKI